MDDDGNTRQISPLPPKYTAGLLAWQVLVARLARSTPDARLRLEIQTTGDGLRFGTHLIWGAQHQQALDYPSIAGALRALHRDLAENQWGLDDSGLDLGRYTDENMLDEQTFEVLERLLSVILTAFGSDWLLSLDYQAIEDPTARVTARLAALGEVRPPGTGPTLRDALHALLLKTAHTLR
jgi:hypothetical protein